jgi:autoinducer 2-degrading protein
MFVTTVMVHVKSDHIDDFIEQTLPNHEASITEAGNLRFDILQSQEDPTRFLLYEAYASREAAAAHKETEHYKRWRERVAEWMAEPRQGIVYTGIRP